MQQFKPKFIDVNYIGTEFNIQRCLRMNDYSEIGDNTHYLVFDMLGMFSFREWSVQQTIHFWLDFMAEIGIKLSHVTIHPDRKDWIQYYPSDLPIVELEENIWSDGTIGGFCTEFFVGDVEIGNIVNPLGTCIDVGFGLQRILNILYNFVPPTKNEIISDTIHTVINSGVTPSSSKQGYVLRKLMVDLFRNGGSINHRFFDDILEKQKTQYLLYTKLKKKNLDKSKEYWLDTYGIDENNLEIYQKIL